MQKIKKHTRKEKMYLLRTLIEIEIKLGYDISDLIAKPLSYFDFEGIELLIIERRNEEMVMNGEIIAL